MNLFAWLTIAAAIVWLAIGLEMARAVFQAHGAMVFLRHPRLLALPLLGLGVGMSFFASNPYSRDEPQATPNLVRFVLTWAGAPEDEAGVEV